MERQIMEVFKMIRGFSLNRVKNLIACKIQFFKTDCRPDLKEILWNRKIDFCPQEPKTLQNASTLTSNISVYQAKVNFFAMIYLMMFLLQDDT